MAHAAILNLVDCFCFIFYESSYPVLNLFLNSVYFVVGLMLTFSWYQYAMSTLCNQLWNGKWLRWVSVVPLAAILIAIAFSFWTGWLFRLDENGFYCRGPYFFLQMIVCGLYLMIPSTISFIRIFMKRFYSDRTINMAFSSIVVLPLLVMFLQTRYLPGTPSISIGLTISVLIIFVNLQSQRISIDPLTGLNNRNHLNRFLDQKVQFLRKNRQLFLFMLDIDKFKDINDNFGRLQGDIVLQIVGDALKSVCGRLGHFIARYGSDEFIVVAELNDFSDALYLRRNILMILTKNSEHLKFPLRLSIGYTLWNRGGDSIPDFISRAEKQLVADKRSKSLERAIS
ncbi:MAG: GGDEF domain-containing protein [Fibrobacter sp.]|nr:GGDEF domain-containing protein [Fibrobacter sp.]